MLSVRNGAKAVEFYETALGAAELFRLDSDTGAVVARLSVETAEFWVADESPEHFNFSPETLGGSSDGDDRRRSRRCLCKGSRRGSHNRCTG